MGLIAWKDEYSVGIKELDAQHQQLIELSNQLETAIIERKTRKIMGDILEGLGNYTIEHFGYEERLFAQYNYPDMISHIKEHKEFIEKVEKLNKEYKLGKISMSVQMLAKIKDWVVNHILVSDKEYETFLQDNLD